jgi:hypothetical protein
MKRKFVFLAMFVCFLAFILAGCDGGGNGGGSTLSGTYAYSPDFSITFSGSSFVLNWGGDHYSGTYTVSGSVLTLTASGIGSRGAWTIINTTTIRDYEGDDWIKSGGSEGTSKTVTFSIDKVNSTTFTVTVSGANWLLYPDPAFNVRSCINTSSITHHYKGPFGIWLTSSYLAFTLGEVRTNDKVVTLTFKSLDEEWYVTGKVELNKNNLAYFGDQLTDGGLSSVYGGSTTYTVNSSKSSITF